jgi:hypothetical protein
MEENKIIPMPLSITRHRVIRLNPDTNGRLTEQLFFIALFVCSWLSIAFGAEQFFHFRASHQASYLACSQFERSQNASTTVPCEKSTKL